MFDPMAGKQSPAPRAGATRTDSNPERGESRGVTKRVGGDRRKSRRGDPGRADEAARLTSLPWGALSLATGEADPLTGVGDRGQIPRP